MISAPDALEQVTKALVSDLAETESFKYQLTPETPYLSEIVKRILESNKPIEYKQKILSFDIINAALKINDDNDDTIKKLWGIHKLYLTQTVDNEWMNHIVNSDNTRTK